MREPNVRLRPQRERFELSLDGRQVSAVVVGALVLLAIVFVLGLNVGKQITLRQTERAPAGDLDALDRAPPPAPAAREEALTYHDKLTKEPPAPLPPAAEPAPPPPQQASPQPSPPAAAPPAATAPSAPPAPQSRPAPAKPWTVQLAAAQERAEADRIATKFSMLNPRVEEANVPGKGRFWRVRVGGFDSREAAERYLRDVARETGAKGFVTPAR